MTYDSLKQSQGYNSDADEKVNVSASEIAKSMTNTLRELNMLPANRLETFEAELVNYLNDDRGDDGEKYRILNILYSLAAGKFDKEQLIELKKILNC